jgi:hypothetical protein
METVIFTDTGRIAKGMVTERAVTATSDVNVCATFVKGSHNPANKSGFLYANAHAVATTLVPWVIHGTPTRNVVTPETPTVNLYVFSVTTFSERV